MIETYEHKIRIENILNFPLMTSGKGNRLSWQNWAWLKGRGRERNKRRNNIKLKALNEEIKKNRKKSKKDSPKSNSDFRSIRENKTNPHPLNQPSKSNKIV